MAFFFNDHIFIPGGGLDQPKPRRALIRRPIYGRIAARQPEAEYHVPVSPVAVPVGPIANPKRNKIGVSPNARPARITQR